MEKNKKVLDFNKKDTIEVTKKDESPPVPPEEKIILLQLVSPHQCQFACLSTDENNNKLEIGIMKRQ